MGGSGTKSLVGLNRGLDAGPPDEYHPLGVFRVATTDRTAAAKPDHVSSLSASHTGEILLSGSILSGALNLAEADRDRNATPTGRDESLLESLDLGEQ